MLRSITFLAGLFLAGAALAQGATPEYLIYSTQAACLARSQAQCSGLGCDLKQTIYWWNCTPLNAGMVGPSAVAPGSYALVVESGDPSFDVTTTNTVAPSAVGLNATEQGKLKTAAQMASVLPAAAPQ